MHVNPDWASRRGASACQDVTGPSTAQLAEVLVTEWSHQPGLQLRRVRLTLSSCGICDPDAAWRPATGAAPGPARWPSGWGSRTSRTGIARGRVTRSDPQAATELPDAPSDGSPGAGVREPPGGPRLRFHGPAVSRRLP